MEYGFVVGMSKDAYEKDPTLALSCAKRMLRRNYDQYLNAEDSTLDPAHKPGVLLGPEYDGFDDDGDPVTMIRVGWYVDTEDPRPDLEPLEAFYSGGTV